MFSLRKLQKLLDFENVYGGKCSVMENVLYLLGRRSSVFINFM